MREPQCKNESIDNRQRREVQLSEVLNRRVAAYAVAATALALPAAAQAPVGHIVYVPANIAISAPGGGAIQLDLNSDGITDFTITTTAGSSSFNSQFFKHAGVFETPAAGNSAIGKRALKAGEAIDLGGQFRSSQVEIAKENFFAASGHFGSYSNGAFKHVTDRYLGVKFLIGGQMHEGWVRISMKCSFGDITGTITGYAYDTVPNETGLIAGQIRSTGTSASSAQPASLGKLAKGAAGLAMWR
jgi:hypothetical protein